MSDRKPGIWSLLAHRRQKHGLYDSPDYWDMKAESYQGLARSNWPSNAYNLHVHRRQMEELDRILPEIRGLRVADVGCGTGRAALHLARRGANVTGFDFAPKALEAAAAESRELGLDVQFQRFDVMAPPHPDLEAQFDVTLSLGCLTLACKSDEEFERALLHVRDLTRVGGRVVFIEPIHESALLKRILRMSVARWIRIAERSGLTLLARRPLLFAPMRYALAFQELPQAIVTPAFQLGEAVLGAAPFLHRLSDYKVLVFRRRDGGRREDTTDTRLPT